LTKAGKTSGTYWVVANLFGLRNTLTRLGRFVWMKERQRMLVLRSYLWQFASSPEDMAEEFIFRKFAGLNSAAVA